MTRVNILIAALVLVDLVLLYWAWLLHQCVLELRQRAAGSCAGCILPEITRKQGATIRQQWIRIDELLDKIRLARGTAPRADHQAPAAAPALAAIHRREGA